MTAPLAWYLATENAEDEVVALAMEESNRFLHHFDAVDMTGPAAAEHAREAAETIAGGIFDIAEIANEIREHLQDSTEATARTLLEARIRLHFER
ncbi:MAG: hypothetical protein Q8M20_14865 [Rhodocyclaceae bacterium]|nr:hypothetical protein [Rhodocyclaceae bacterium]MDZ4216281.1 hypothetical protein [Rhodocyclaceae bacterium]